MIVTKTPLRVSFVGGGSDLPVFYRRYGGAVLSTSINKFVYITVNSKFDHRIRITYSRTEEPASVDKIKHPLVREALELAAGSAELKIRLNPKDHANLRGQVEAVARELAPLAKCELIADAQITPGGCRVETRFGVIDQQFEAQLARIEDELA